MFFFFSFYFWQHWVTVLGQILYHIKISSCRSCAVNNCTGCSLCLPSASPLLLLTDVTWTWGKVQAWHAAPLLADTPRAAVLGIIRGSTLLRGIAPLMWRLVAWGGQRWGGERGGEAQGPLYPPNLYGAWSWSPILTSAWSSGGREREPAVELPCSFLHLCVVFCVSCMRAHKCECIHSDSECVHVLSGLLCFLMTRLSQRSAFRRTSCDHLTAVQHSSRHTRRHWDD